MLEQIEKAIGEFYLKNGKYPNALEFTKDEFEFFKSELNTKFGVLPATDWSPDTATYRGIKVKLRDQMVMRVCEILI